MEELATIGDPFPPLGRFFWLIAIGFGFINAVILWRRCIPNATPEQRPGYARYIVGYVLVNLILWGVMGIGILVGGVPSVFAYLTFSPDPYVTAFWVTLVLLWVVSIGWIVFGGGATFLVRHPGLFKLSHPLFLKLFMSFAPLFISLMFIATFGVQPWIFTPAIVAGLVGLAGVAFEMMMKPGARKG